MLMNKVMLIGNVGTDPDVHYYDADQAVARLRKVTQSLICLKEQTQLKQFMLMLLRLA